MGDTRRLVFVVSVVVFLDTMLYAVLAPLLPELAHSLGLSKLSAGILTASYPLGVLVGSVPGGLLVMRIGPRATVVSGLSLLAVSSIAFGWLHSIAALDIARFVEGFSGACSWAGGLAWIVVATAKERRGALIGRALGAAIGGALFGPVLGTLATAIGRQASFTAFAVLVALLIPRTLALPSPPATHEASGRLISALRAPGVVAAAWLVALPAIASGTVNVLGPLRMHTLGAGAIVIGGAYLAAAALEAAMAPAVGALSDRRGRMLPVRAGLTAATIVLLCFAIPRSFVVVGLLIVLISAALGLFWAPAMAMLADAAQAHGLHQGLAAALMNLAWAGGQIIGSGAGGALAKSAGDGWPLSLTAGLCAVTLVGVTWTRRGRLLDQEPAANAGRL